MIQIWYVSLIKLHLVLYGLVQIAITQYSLKNYTLHNRSIKILDCNEMIKLPSYILKIKKGKIHLQLSKTIFFFSIHIIVNYQPMPPSLLPKSTHVTNTNNPFSLFLLQTQATNSMGTSFHPNQPPPKILTPSPR